MLLSADSLMIIFIKIYCYWTRTVGVIAKGCGGPVFLRHSVLLCCILVPVACDVWRHGLFIITGRPRAICHCFCHRWGLHLYSNFVALPSAACWPETKWTAYCVCLHQSEDIYSTTDSQSVPVDD